MRRSICFVALLLGACSPNPAANERAGDRAYAESRFADALARYQAAVDKSPSPDLWAKVGAAALRLGDYTGSAEAYRSLAASDPDRTSEAASGLERAARAAQDAGEFDALRQVLLALRVVAPERTAGRFALEVVRHTAITGSEQLALLPGAVASAPTTTVADSLLTAYADALREIDACGQAIRIYRTVSRRVSEEHTAALLQQGLATCAYDLGQASLEQQPWEAEGWFLEAADAVPDSELSRRAMIGLGQSRAAQGDLIGAALAYQAAIDPAAEDSISLRAADLLNDIVSAETRQDTIPAGVEL